MHAHFVSYVRTSLSFHLLNCYFLSCLFTIQYLPFFFALCVVGLLFTILPLKGRING